MRRILVWCAGGAMLSCAALPVVAYAQQSASEQLKHLFHDAWEFSLREDPLFATDVGDARYNHLLPRMRPEDHTRRRKRREEFLSRLRSIDHRGLSRQEQVSRECFGRLLEAQLAEHDFGGYLMPITNRTGFHISFAELPKQVPLRTVDDYENYIARLKAFPQYVEDHIALLQLAIRRDMVLPGIVMHDYATPIEAQLVADPSESLLFEPFTRFPDAVGSEDRGRLAAAASKAIGESVIPAYRDFLDFMRDQYVANARGSIGLSGVPNGRAFYRHRVRTYTTLDVLPDEVHHRGLAEVERIRQEMDAVRQRAGFEGSHGEFVALLRSDPRFYADTPEDLLKEVALVLKKMDGRLPQLFRVLPRTPYGIREIPDYIAPKTTTAYYWPPAGDGSRAGFYYVNTYNLRSRPLYEVEALSLHEAVPGHHLQIALQQEMTGLPDFRRFADFTAFIEGWGLYAERLGLEVGFYQDPYSDFGRLSYEMWRACRLVVDTGIHYFGWTRKQAIDFMAENTALSRLNIEAEVDRYIAWPGQALAYKMGELKIRELRALAQQQLGSRFDVREFHHVVLGSGAVPLDVLENQVNGYIEATLATARTSGD